MSDQKNIILAIETSCDETAASIVKNGRGILSNIIYSQIETHMKFGGVVPEIASRKHMESISLVVDEALSSASLSFKDIDAIAVTCGPGLVGALLVGVSYAKGLAWAIKKPLIGVHHIEGHICANYLCHKDLQPPYIALVASGGHTHLVYVKDYASFQTIGKTKDDAVGEAYDKVARSIGLGYPGGPKIDELAATGNPLSIPFPKALLGQGFDFSFSGVKSAVLNYLNQAKMSGQPIIIADVAASFQKAVVDVLVSKAIAACRHYGITTLALAGGVACNRQLRKDMESACLNNNIEFFVPPPILCTDNAAMIGCRGYYHFLHNEWKGLDLNAYPSLNFLTY